MSIEFWATSIVVTATPGTGALFTIAAAMARGTRAGLVAALGCTLGIVPHLVLALTGAAALLAASPVAFEALKWAGVAYLLYLAWGIWRQGGAFAQEAPGKGDGEGDGAPVARGAGRVIVDAILVNLLNPKLALFFFVFLPMFVAAGEGAILRMAGLGLVFMAVTLVVFSVYAVCAAWLRRFVVGRPVVMRWIGRGFALAFVVLAVLLGLTRH